MSEPVAADAGRISEPPSIVAMILAAGFGTRMAPLSRVVPKALLPVLGRPLLEWVLRHLATQGITDAVVNAHHLPEPVITWAAAQASSDTRSGGTKALPRVRVVREPVILGTAGGIANAAPLLTSDPVLIHNVDLLLRFDLAALRATHRTTGALATLVLVRDPTHAQIAVRGAHVTGIARRPDPSARDLWCYSGVALLSQEALRTLPAGGFAELTPHLRRWAEAGRLGAHFERAPFRDVGTLESYLEVHRELLRAPDRSRWLADDPPSGASGTVSGPHESFVDPSASIGHGACITASVVLAESSVADGAILDLALLGPGSSASGVCERVAICEGESRPLRLLPTTDEAACLRFLEEHPIPGASTAPERPRLSLLHGDGSRRRIVRVLRADASAILVWNPPMPLPPNYPARTGPGIPDENESFCYVRDHLAGLGIHVPRIDAFDRARGLLLMEDLGSTRLADLPEQRPEEREAAYEQAIDLLVLLQSPAEVSFDPERTFNLAYDSAFVRRYELEYFQREMVEGRAGLPTAEAGLRAEYDAIAQHTQAGSRVLMHRDFQSRNLMVTRRGLALIDFQGARPGPPGYDLASLLWDPYVELGDLRERLLQRYLRRTGRETAEAESFRAELRPVAIARLLQALGAFAFLGGRLGKAGFLEHAPRALDRVIALAEPSYPHLARCAGSVRDALAGR